MDNALKITSKTDTEIRVANYMALFGGRDLDGEYFTKNTDFNSPYTEIGRLPVDWEHGIDDDDDSPGRDDVLGYVDWKTARVDDKGLWVERVLSRRNQYMQFLEQLVEEGLLGSSSEAVAGKVRRTDDGEIQVWPLKRDALTVRPAEPRMLTANAISALKHLAEVYPALKSYLPEADGESAGTDPGRRTEPAQIKENDMTEQNVTISQDEYIDFLVQKRMAENEPAPAPQKSKEEPWEAPVGALAAQLEEITDFFKNSPALKDAGYVSPDSEGDHAERKSFGDFLVAIRQGNTPRLQKVYKAALAESAGTTGGYQVPTEFAGPIEKGMAVFSPLRLAGAQVEQMVSNEKEVPVVDMETAPSAGNTSYAGGAIAYWISEGGSITQSEPTFKLIRLVAHKLAGYARASSEVREDAAASVDGLLARSFSKALGSQENYQFFRGDGVGKPKGILESGALISATRSAASTVALADIAQMLSDFVVDERGAWFINPEVIDQLAQLVSNPLSWATDVRSALPTQLFGYPVYKTGALPALNTAGDILLVAPEYYLIGDRGGLQIAFSEHDRFQNDQVSWRVIKRVDGQPLVDGTITLENASTVVSPFVALAAG